jgi:hypothetical protein
MNLHDDLRTLPEPVSRYFEHALAEERRAIHAVGMTQRGMLRTDPRRQRWMKFRAEHVVAPQSRSFCWDARVRVGPLLHVQVRDRYASGVGSGQVRLLSAFTVASDANRPELNAASLHRYLAEAVWYPTALLPSAGVRWSPVDDRTALATLSDRGNAVSLEFRFNDLAEVVGVYAEGRWSKTANGFERMPWEGHFSGYRRHQGLLVPAAGEVGWYVDGRLQVVWKGEITSLAYEFTPAG